MGAGAECGAVFTDETRRGRCPTCGNRYLLWNPAMETRVQAAEHRHAAGAAAEDLKPGTEDREPPDLTKYWELLRKDL